MLVRKIYRSAVAFKEGEKLDNQETAVSFEFIYAVDPRVGQRSGRSGFCTVVSESVL